MRVPIELESFRGRSLHLETGGLFRQPRLVVGDAVLKPIYGWGGPRFCVEDDTGTPLTISTRPRLIDPIPTVWVDGRRVQIASSFSGYETFLLFLPFVVPVVMLFLGSLYQGNKLLLIVVGAIAGYEGSRCLAQNFRTLRFRLPHWILSFLVSAGVAGLLLWIDWALRLSAT